MKRDTAAVRSLVQQKVDVNAPGKDGTPALHWMVRVDDLQTAELLIRAGKRMHRAKKKRTREALDCFRDALTFAPTNDLARKGFEELSGRRSVRRRATAAIAAASAIVVATVVVTAAMPSYWCGLAPRTCVRACSDAGLSTTTGPCQLGST